MRSRYLLSTALLLALAGCRPSAVQELSLPVVLQASLSALPAAFCLAEGATIPYLAYNDRDTRALVLTALDGSSPPVYLERITDLPEQGPGAHLLFGSGEDLHLLYLDRQSEDSLLLKYVKKSTKSGTMWIDVLPQAGYPVAAFVAQDGSLDLFLERDQALLREGRQAELVRAAFHAGGRAELLDAGDFQGFTVFDATAHRLLLFRIRGREIEQREVARFGQAQDSSLDPEGQLQIAAYDPGSCRILLFQTADPAAGFNAQPVTLSRGTSSLALVRLSGGGLGFLFNELSTQRQQRYQISLLHPAAGNGYRKTVLYRSPRPIIEVRAAPAGDALLVAFVETNLRVLRLEYAALGER